MTTLPFAPLTDDTVTLRQHSAARTIASLVADDIKPSGRLLDLYRSLADSEAIRLGLEPVSWGGAA